VGEELLPAAAYEARFHHPERVRKALRGERDLPPQSVRGPAGRGPASFQDAIYGGNQLQGRGAPG
jgi:hypothetical protein